MLLHFSSLCIQYIFLSFPTPPWFLFCDALIEAATYMILKGTAIHSYTWLAEKFTNAYFVSMGQGRSCVHLNFTPWRIYHKVIGTMQIPRISWFWGAKCCSSPLQPQLRARGRFLGKMDPQNKRVSNSEECPVIWCGPYTWKENETLKKVRDWPEYVSKDPAKLHNRGMILPHRKQIYYRKIFVDPGTDKSM